MLIFRCNKNQSATSTMAETQSGQSDKKSNTKSLLNEEQGLFCPGCKEAYSWIQEDCVPTSLTCGHSLCYKVHFYSSHRYYYSHITIDSMPFCSFIHVCYAVICLLMLVFLVWLIVGLFFSALGSPPQWGNALYYYQYLY